MLSLAVWLVVLGASAPPARAQDPEPSAVALIVAGDPRSDGEGPGLVGSPIEIALAVVVLGLVTTAGTALVIRLTRR
jgi:hypothetical protein